MPWDQTTALGSCEDSDDRPRPLAIFGSKIMSAPEDKIKNTWHATVIEMSCAPVEPRLPACVRFVSDSEGTRRGLGVGLVPVLSNYHTSGLGGLLERRSALFRRRFRQPRINQPRSLHLDVTLDLSYPLPPLNTHTRFTAIAYRWRPTSQSPYCDNACVPQKTAVHVFIGRSRPPAHWHGGLFVACMVSSQQQGLAQTLGFGSDVRITRACVRNIL